MQTILKEIQYSLKSDPRAVIQAKTLLKKYYTDNFYLFFKDFYPIVKGTPFKLHSTVQYVCEYLTLFANNEIQDLVLSVYRGWGKSVVCSEFLPAWLLLRDSGERIGCYSRAMTNDAKLWHKNTGAILQHPIIDLIFGDDFAIDKTNETIITTSTNGYRRLGSCLASSVGSDLTTAILDDPQDQEHYRSEAKRQRFFNFLTNSLSRAVRTTKYLEDDEYFKQLTPSQKKEWDFEKSFNASDTTLQRQPKMLLTMQRLFSGDAVSLKLQMHEEMLRNGVEHKFEYIAIPAVMQEDKIFIMPLTKEKVEVKRDDYIVAGTASRNDINKAKYEMSPEDFSAQMLMVPLESASVLFKKEYINYIENIDNIAFEEICLSFDTAFKTEGYNDPTACLVFGIYKSKIYVLESHVKRIAFPELLIFTKDIIKKYQDKYSKRVSTLIEDKGSGQSLIQDLKHNGVFGIIPCQPKGSKQDRLQKAITSIKTTLESGGFYLPKHSNWVASYVNELFNFPNSLHDDQVDATAQFFNWWGERKQNISAFDAYRMMQNKA